MRDRTLVSQREELPWDSARSAPGEVGSGVRRADRRSEAKRRLLAHPSLEQRDLSNVRLIIDGGEKMRLPLIERLSLTLNRRQRLNPE